jgi:alpha-mannosidase
MPPRERHGVWDSALLVLEPSTLLLSAVKPADDGEGIVVRVVNPGGTSARAARRVGLDVRSAHAVRGDAVTVRPVR